MIRLMAKTTLDSFSLLSGSRVSLVFADGKSVTVTDKQLGRHLTGDDLLRVQKALRLRRSFISEIPPWAQMVMIGLGLGLLFTGTYIAGSTLAPARPAATPTQTKPQPAASPTAQPVLPVAPAPAPDPVPESSSLPSPDTSLQALSASQLTPAIDSLQRTVAPALDLLP